MAIEFIIEDGTGKTDSTSYCSVEQFRQYWTNKGTDYTATADDTIKAWLNSATEYIDLEYNFKGQKTDNDQALEWPRANCPKSDSEYYDSDEIPTTVINATSYIAAQSDTELFSEESNVSAVTHGPTSKTFNGSSATRSFPIVDKFFKFMVKPNGIIRVN